MRLDRASLRCKEDRLHYSTGGPSTRKRRIDHTWLVVLFRHVRSFQLSSLAYRHDQSDCNRARVQGCRHRMCSTVPDCSRCVHDQNVDHLTPCAHCASAVSRSLRGTLVLLRSSVPFYGVPAISERVELPAQQSPNHPAEGRWDQ
jgi:hypothetical protein